VIKYKAVAILVLSLCVLVCGKTENPVNSPGFKFESSQSSCNKWLPTTTGVIFSSHGDTILVVHKDAYYNCCSKIKVNVKGTSNGFDLSEYDVGDICRCMCYFDVTTTISDLSPGTYLIRYFDIDGDLAGSGVIDIPSKYTGSESSQSKCKWGLYKTDAQATPDTLQDSILVWSHGGTAWVMHKNAYENCASVIETRIERTIEGFDLYEHDISTVWATCLCYFDITTTIYGLSPGVYIIRVFDTAGNLVGEVELVIPPKTKNVDGNPQKIVFA
jgi:uncharacterized protein (DUF2141 family)